MRYEVGVATNLTFHTREPGHALIPFPEPETVVIVFEGRRFVWHALGPNDEGEARWPVVTTMVADPNDYAAERIAMERFLSALSYLYRQPIEVVIAGGAGWKQEMDSPLVNALRRGLADHLHGAPSEVVMGVDDPRLRIVLGYNRDGLNTGSPFFKFLAFWNALDVACEDYEGRLPAWIGAHAAQFAHLRGDAPPPADWWDYLQNERRSAVAHAVRDPDRGADLDPDDPEDRAKLAQDARLLEHLVRVRIQQRWGDHPLWGRPRE